MYCVSHRALLGAFVSVSAAALLIFTGSGAYAGAIRPVTMEPVTAESEPAIVFTGSAMAPLICTSTPDTPAVTITVDMRVTLANLTGAEASVDTGTAQALTVADGVGVSVRFRPGQYVVRLVPDCALTNDIGASVVTVMDESGVAPAPTTAPTPSLPETVRQPTPSGSRLVGPTGGSGSRATPTVPAAVADPPPPGGSAVPITESPTAGSAGSPPEPTSSGVVSPAPRPAWAVGDHDPVIYDVVMVPVQQPGDPRVVRLLAVIAVICVFGVTTAIIRAILTQRARGMVST